MNNVQACEILAKHLPPSASDLKLFDVNGEVGDILCQLRPDIDPVEVPGYADGWSQEIKQPDRMDSVVVLDYVLNESFLRASFDVLRPGGRLIILNSIHQDLVSTGNLLEALGYVRILVEEVHVDGTQGTLIRGEKPHRTASTLDRVQQVARQDDQLMDWMNYRGRFVSLLIRRTPNLPPWKIDSSIKVEWQAAALSSDATRLLGFSSLPKAVGFMQPAVMQGKIHDVNHVAKFKKDIVTGWEKPLILNPSPDVLDSGNVVFIPIDPADAEAPDE